jgi:hypothetical protein
MKAPSELSYPEKLPDDLKLLLKEQKIPANDPLVMLLAWHWLRINETREAIQDDRLKLEVALDQRLEKMVAWTKELEFLNGHLEQLSKVLKEEPLHVSRKIQEELARPIAESVNSAKQLVASVGGLVNDVAKSRKSLHRSHVITAFLSGYATAALIISWTFSHFFSH